MKKSSVELKKELIEVRERLDYLWDKYPYYYKSKGYYHISPIPDDIKKEYRYLRSRIKNLKTDINHMIWKEFGEDARCKQNKESEKA